MELKTLLTDLLLKSQRSTNLFGGIKLVITNLGGNGYVQTSKSTW